MRSTKNKSNNTRFTFTIDKDLKKCIERCSLLEQRSISNFICNTLNEKCEEMLKKSIDK